IQQILVNCSFSGQLQVALCQQLCRTDSSNHAQGKSSWFSVLGLPVKMDILEFLVKSTVYSLNNASFLI
ncbi:mCG1042649, partial [Mus musculus]